MSERLDDTPMAPDVPQTSLSNQEALSEAGWLGRAITVAARGFAVCILAAMAILVMEVFLRYVFNRPTIWAHETSIFLSAVTFIFGGLYCVARNTHIRVVLIYDVVRASLRHLLDVVISIACLGASLFFAWASWLMVKKAMFRPDGSWAGDLDQHRYGEVPDHVIASNITDTGPADIQYNAGLALLREKTR